jgi:endonuclease/exonuclease/phosphatase family metal-dependent hydrolase
MDQSEIIAEAAGLPHVLKQRNGDILVPFRTLRFGNAILSRHPISDAKFLELPAFKRWEDILGAAHHAASCRITLPGGEIIQVIPVYLEVLDEATRIAGVETIAKAVTQSGLSSLVLGDFNSFPAANSSNAISKLMELTGLTPVAGAELTEKTFTFPSNQPDRRLDWIFTPASWQIRSWKVHLTEFSDHAFVTAIVEAAIPK